MASIRKRQGRYQAQVRRRGYPPVSKTFTSITAAKKWVKATEVDMERRVFTSRVTMTVGELLTRYDVEEVPKLKGGAAATTYRVKALKKNFGEIPLVDLTPKMLTKYRDQRLKTVKAITVKGDLSVLSSAINTAMIEWGLGLPDNPVSRVRFKKIDVPRDKRLRPGEEELLLNHASELMRRIIIVAIETAMRRSEILRIKKSHIDFQTKTLLIPETKTDKPRTIPLSTRAVNALREQSGPSGSVVFLLEPELFQITKGTLYNQFQKVLSAAGIVDFRFHDLRHEATSRLFEKGLNMMEVASITGHEDLKMLKRYTHIRPESLVERLG